MIPQIVILAGGMATRLFPVTKTIPKAMIDLNGEPFISHQLRLLKKKGISDVLICAGYLGEQIRDFVEDGTRFGLNVAYSFDGEKLLGTGGAIRNAAKFLKDEFFVMYGDSYLDIDYKNIYEAYKKSNKDGLMVIIENSDKWDTSNVHFEDGKLLRYDKKNKDNKMKYIDYGISILKKNEIMKIIEGEVKDLSEVFSTMVNEGRMAGFEEVKRFYEIGSFKGLEETKEYIKGE